MKFTCPIVFSGKLYIYIFIDEVKNKRIQISSVTYIYVCAWGCACTSLCVSRSEATIQGLLLSRPLLLFETGSFMARSTHCLARQWAQEFSAPFVLGLCFHTQLFFFLWVLPLWTQLSGWPDRHFTNWTISQLSFHHSYLHPTSQQRWNIHKKQAVGIWV